MVVEPQLTCCNCIEYTCIPVWLNLLNLKFTCNYTLVPTLVFSKEKGYTQGVMGYSLKYLKVQDFVCTNSPLVTLNILTMYVIE